MFSNRRHGQPCGKSKQPTDTLSESRMKLRGPSVAAVRHTSNLTLLAGPAHQPRKRRTRNTLLFCHAALGGPGQYLFHRPQIAVKLLALWFWKRRGIKRRTRNEGGWLTFNGSHPRRLWFGQKRVRECLRHKHRSIREEQGQRQRAREGG